MNPFVTSENRRPAGCLTGVRARINLDLPLLRAGGSRWLGALYRRLRGAPGRTAYRHFFFGRRSGSRPPRVSVRRDDGNAGRQLVGRLSEWLEPHRRARLEDRTRMPEPEGLVSSPVGRPGRQPEGRAGGRPLPGTGQVHLELAPERMGA